MGSSNRTTGGWQTDPPYSTETLGNFDDELISGRWIQTGPMGERPITIEWRLRYAMPRKVLVAARVAT
jgi:hypothetical protein